MSKSNMNNVELKNLTKQSITEAMIILMNDKPYCDITITDVCEKAGVSRNAFYRNYPAKDAILRRYMYEITHEWRLRIRKFGHMTFHHFFTSIFIQINQYKLLLRVLS